MAFIEPMPRNKPNIIYLLTGPFYKHGLTSIPVWIRNYKSSKVWDEITYPFPNGETVEVWERLSNFIPHFIMDVITYPCQDESETL